MALHLPARDRALGASLARGLPWWRAPTDAGSKCAPLRDANPDRYPSTGRAGPTWSGRSTSSAATGDGASSTHSWAAKAKQQGLPWLRARAVAGRPASDHVLHGQRPCFPSPRQSLSYGTPARRLGFRWVGQGIAGQTGFNGDVELVMRADDFVPFDKFLARSPYVEVTENRSHHGRGSIRNGVLGRGVGHFARKWAQQSELSHLGHRAVRWRLGPSSSHTMTCPSSPEHQLPPMKPRTPASKAHPRSGKSRLQDSEIDPLARPNPERVGKPSRSRRGAPITPRLPQGRVW